MKNIPHNQPTLGKEEEIAARRVIKSGWLAQGKEVEEFEDAFCNFVGLPSGHSVAVSSGTAALYLSLWVLNAKNKKVAFPSYVCASVKYAVNLSEGHSVIVDTAANSPNISINELNNSGCDIAIAPHMFGIPVNIPGITTPVIIEDCCQSIGAQLHGKSVGLHGDIGIYSFYATKLITSGGQGGMIVSNDKSIINEIKDYRLFDMRNDNKMRFNFQMTDLQAAIGIEQLKKLPDFLKRREEISLMYQNAGLTLQKADTPNSKQVYYRAVLKTDKSKELIEKLAKKQIKGIVPIEDWELLDQTANALNYTQKTISLPLYPNLTNKQVKLIIDTLQ